MWNKKHLPVGSFQSKRHRCTHVCTHTENNTSGISTENLVEYYQVNYWDYFIKYILYIYGFPFLEWPSSRRDISHLVLKDRRDHLWPKKS